jgi:hypothetical protein
MHRAPLIVTTVALLACAACAPERARALPALMDVSGDDCTASALVFAGPHANPDSAVAFINDGCAGDRIFLGIAGSRRELRRAANVPLGTGGAYSDGEYRVIVQRGRAIARTEVASPPDAFCPEPDQREYAAAYEATVRISSSAGSWTLFGTLRRDECGS